MGRRDVGDDLASLSRDLSAAKSAPTRAGAAATRTSSDCRRRLGVASLTSKIRVTSAAKSAPTALGMPPSLSGGQKCAKAGRLLAMRADRLLSLTIGTAHHDPDTGRLPVIAGELRMIRAAMHLACAEAAGVGAEADQTTAQKFLKQVAPQLLTDLVGIVSHPEFVRG